MRKTRKDKKLKEKKTDEKYEEGKIEEEKKKSGWRSYREGWEEEAKRGRKRRGGNNRRRDNTYQISNRKRRTLTPTFCGFESCDKWDCTDQTQGWVVVAGDQTEILLLDLGSAKPLNSPALTQNLSNPIRKQHFCENWKHCGNKILKPGQ